MKRRVLFLAGAFLLWSQTGRELQAGMITWGTSVFAYSFADDNDGNGQTIQQVVGSGPSSEASTSALRGGISDFSFATATAGPGELHAAVITTPETFAQGTAQGSGDASAFFTDSAEVMALHPFLGPTVTIEGTLSVDYSLSANCDVGDDARIGAIFTTPFSSLSIFDNTCGPRNQNFQVSSVFLVAVGTQFDLSGQLRVIAASTCSINDVPPNVPCTPAQAIASNTAIFTLQILDPGFELVTTSGATYSAVEGVPEPATGWLFAAALALFGRALARRTAPNLAAA